MAVLGPVATAYPPHRLAQGELQEVAQAVLGQTTMLRVFSSARVEQRALACPVEWYLAPHGHGERNATYAEVGLRLAVEASIEALVEAGHRPKDMGAIVFVSTTGIATPSLDARLAQAIGCRDDVRRVPVWGLGCAGGVGGVNRAVELAQATGAPVLLVCLELCSLQFDVGAAGAVDGEHKKAMVAASLFSDGCAAVVVSPGEEGLHHLRGMSHLFPDTERVMGWDVTDTHLDVVLSPRIPEIVADQLPGILVPWLDGEPIEHWLLHPGGARVIDAFEQSLHLRPGDLAATSEVLAAHGNMSSPTVLAVLQHRMRTAGIARGETVLLGALGPGFAAEFALLRMA